MNLLWVEKVKTKLIDVIKEHMISVLVFLAATVIWAILGDGYHDDYLFGKVLPFFMTFLFCLTSGILLCESIKLNYAGFGRKGKIACAVVMVISIVVSFWYAAINSILESLLEKNVQGAGVITGTTYDFVIFYIVATLGFTVYFLYKRSGEKFEIYCAKAFCGLMKALLIYGIIALGVLIVLLIFSELIVDTSGISLILRAEILIIGFVAYPCALMGFSKTEDSVSKFARVVLSYILPGILLIAFLIIYLYIFKILFTWQFPKNQVFSILTALFSSGIVIWTMAAGSCDEKFASPVKLMPFLFIPFIVLQIMCLHMRVADYGYTKSRFFGLALIIFEILYFVMYSFCYFMKKEMTYSLIFLIIAVTFFSLVMPFTNYRSVILMSQKFKIEEYFTAEKSDAVKKKAAYEAYKTIWCEGGYTGYKYLHDNYSEEQIEDLKNGSDTDGAYSDSFYIYASNDFEFLNIDGYKQIYFVDFEIDSSETDKAVIETKEGNKVGTANISSIISKLTELDKEGILDSDRSREIISGEIDISPNGKLIITYLNISGDYSAENEVDSINVSGYVLK